MQITKAAIADAKKITDLVNRSYRGDDSRLGWTTEADLLEGIRISQDGILKMFSTGQGVFLKATDDREEIIGCVYLRKDDEKLYLGMLTVEPAKQARGTGKQLLFAGEKYAIQSGCESVYMKVITERSELIDWYMRHGYSDTSERMPYQSERLSTPNKPLEFMILEKKLG